MISLMIKDGLGNQLFQYAYTRYLQELYNSDKQIDEEIVINTYYMSNHDFRKIALQHFKLNDHVRFLKFDEQKADFHEFQKRVLFANGLNIIPWKVTKSKKPLGQKKFVKRAKKGLYYTYTSQTDFGAPLSKARDKYVFGCFQGEKNFLPIADIIKDELQIITPMSEANRAMLEQIGECDSVCLHIRRGDYLDDKWKALQICNFDYYNDSINEMMQRVENPIFFVFSNSHDDLEWIKENYHFVNKVDKREVRLVYVDLNNPDYEELRLMMNCKHFIISNSTFSWWAAYLSQIENPLVFVPERWNLSMINDASIYLDEWHKVKLRKS